MLLLVASNALESLLDRAGIVRKELAFEFAPVVSFRSPYRLFNTVLGFFVQCTVATLEGFFLLFQFNFQVFVEPWLIVAEHYQCWNAFYTTLASTVPATCFIYGLMIHSVQIDPLRTCNKAGQ